MLTFPPTQHEADANQLEQHTMTASIADDLIATVERAAGRLRGLTAAQVSSRPAPDRWTIKEVIGHLIDSAANNHQRFVRGQFIDKLVFPKYEQNEWVACQHYNDRDWSELIDLWQSYNGHVAHVMRTADPKALGVTCVIGSYEPVTLLFLMEDYVVHLKHHLKKIAERVGWEGFP
jgi:hypothetical protein